MKKTGKKVLPLTLCVVLVLSGCSGSSNKAASAGGEGKADPDPNKTYDITYTGQWCFSDYEDGSFAERMIEDALNINLTVEKAETVDTIDLLLASGEMPDCMWTESKTPSWMQEQELIRTIPRSMVEKYCPTLKNITNFLPIRINVKRITNSVYSLIFSDFFQQNFL